MMPSKLPPSAARGRDLGIVEIPLTVMVLVNAISFDAKWEEPYEEDMVNEGVFTNHDGTTSQAMFLSDKTNAYYETDKAIGFIKYYKGGRYAFAALLPDEDTRFRG